MAKERKSQQNTILDIAEALKLSPATISRALNNHPYVKEKTRKAVMEMAAQLSYRRNQMASGLRSNKTHTIGLIVPRISMYFHAEVITAIQNSLHNNGFNLIICQSNDSLKMEKELTEIMFSSRVDALIAACTLFTTDFSHFDKLIEDGKPVIFYDRAPMAVSKAAVIKGDDFNGGYLSANHLIDAGCKRIAHISGPLTSNLYRDRSAGFTKAMEESGLQLNDNWVFHHELTAENALTDIAALFEAEVVPDGICTDNDSSAIAVLQFAKEHGIKVPQDLKIVGYSNDPRTAIITPSITTIEQFPKEVGHAIVKVLLDLLKSKDEGLDVVSPAVIIPVKLIKRMST